MVPLPSLSNRTQYSTGIFRRLKRRLRGHQQRNTSTLLREQAGEVSCYVTGVFKMGGTFSFQPQGTALRLRDPLPE